MDLDLLKRVRRTSILFGAPMAVVITTYWGLGVGGGWTAGVAWSLVNLYFLGSLIQKVVTAADRQPAAIAVAVFIKFPVLYAAGFILLWNGFLSVAGLVAGFTWPFFVLMMKGLGRYYLRLDDFRRHTADHTPADSEGKPSQI
jgi:hypothetical protein